MNQTAREHGPAPKEPSTCSLDEPTLVLNRWWLLVSVTTVADALCKLYTGAANAIHQDDFSIHDFHSWIVRGVDSGRKYVRTPSLWIQIPEVILLTHFEQEPRREVSFSRTQVFRRDHYQCQYCGRNVGRGNITMDHILARSRGGKTTWTNCVSCCTICNARKGSRTPKEAGMSLLKDPGKPVWSPDLLLQRYQAPHESWRKFFAHLPSRPHHS